MDDLSELRRFARGIEGGEELIDRMTEKEESNRRRELRSSTRESEYRTKRRKRKQVGGRTDRELPMEIKTNTINYCGGF